MSKEEIRNLLGGYATGTLTEAERKALFEAALQDDELFAALGAEQPLKDLLDDPRARAELLHAVGPVGAKKQGAKRWYWISGLGTAGIAVAILVPMMRPNLEKQEENQTIIARALRPDRQSEPALPPVTDSTLQRYVASAPRSSTKARPNHSEPRPPAETSYSIQSAPPAAANVPEQIRTPNSADQARAAADQARAAKELTTPDRLDRPSSTFLPSPQIIGSEGQLSVAVVDREMVAVNPSPSSPPPALTKARSATPEAPASGSTPDGVRVTAVLVEQTESTARVRLSASAAGFLTISAQHATRTRLFSSPIAIAPGVPIEAHVKIAPGAETLTISYQRLPAASRLSVNQNAVFIPQVSLVPGRKAASRSSEVKNGEDKAGESSVHSKSAPDSPLGEPPNLITDPRSSVTFELPLKK